MQNHSYVVTGTVTDAHTIKLDESLPLSSAKVRLTIEALPTSRSNRYQEVMAAIRRRQYARAHQPPTPAEVEQFLRGERESWE